MNCPNCHNPISENQSVCYSCGARLDGASDVPPETVPDGLTAQPQADFSESMHTEQPQTEPPQPPMSFLPFAAQAGLWAMCALPACSKKWWRPVTAHPLTCPAMTKTVGYCMTA